MTGGGKGIPTKSSLVSSSFQVVLWLSKSQQGVLKLFCLVCQFLLRAFQTSGLRFSSFWNEIGVPWCLCSPRYSLNALFSTSKPPSVENCSKGVFQRVLQGLYLLLHTNSFDWAGPARLAYPRMLSNQVAFAKCES